jgi:hypothetical protein
MTCPLCGQKQHEGPCYRELREEWKERRLDDLIEASLARIRAAGYSFHVDAPAIGEACHSAAENESIKHPISQECPRSGHSHLSGHCDGLRHP